MKHSGLTTREYVHTISMIFTILDGSYACVAHMYYIAESEVTMMQRLQRRCLQLAGFILQEINLASIFS